MKTGSIKDGVLTRMIVIGEFWNNLFSSKKQMRSN